MSNKKPFKTLDELIEIIEGRNVYIGDRERAKRFLARESYYAVINGYKDPFIDKVRTEERGEDWYKDRTTIVDFELLYLIDTRLRELTRNILMHAESVMRSTTVYAFCYYNRDAGAYLDPASYVSINEYHHKDSYTRNLIRLLGVLQGVRDNRTHKEYIEHYSKKHHCVPLWVASKALTFGNMSAFYDLQKTSVKNATCRNIEYAIGSEPKSLGANDVWRAYSVLSGFRNICAHKERLYCARVGKSRYSFKDMLELLSLTTGKENLEQYVRGIVGLVNLALPQEDDSDVYKIFMDGLGITIEEMKEKYLPVES